MKQKRKQYPLMLRRSNKKLNFFSKKMEKHKRPTKREEQEQKRILELKLKVLQKKNPKAQQFYEREVLHQNEQSLYEKHRKLFEKQQHEVDEEKLVEDEVFDTNKSKADAFFLDPEEDKEVLEMAQKQVEMKIQQEPERNLNASKFLPFQNLSFRGQNGEVVNLHLHSNKFGSKVQTPSLKQQQILDPNNFSSNPNFMPIPEEKNKILQKMQEKLKNIKEVGEDDGIIQSKKKRLYSTMESIFGGEDDDNEEEEEAEEEEEEVEKDENDKDEPEILPKKQSNSGVKQIQQPIKQQVKPHKEKEELAPKKKKTRRAGKKLKKKRPF